jgi:D-serine deaminase-like pyridoxal phosphate-dependent protein
VDYQMTISTPFAWVDLDIMENNIIKMTSDLKKYGVRHRPHIKTHKSIEIAKMQLAAGAVGITCAKISEAQVMAEAGIRDILIAYSLVGRDKMERLGKLMDIADIKVTVDNMIAAKQLSALALSKDTKIKIFIEVATHIKRGGVKSGEDLIAFAKLLSKMEGLAFEGLFGYYGISPTLKRREDIKLYAREEVANLVKAKKILENNGMAVKYLSGGSSVTSICPEEFTPLTESRAGNYVFYDVNYVNLGAVSLENCALRVKTTVISMPEAGYLTIDAGSKTLGSDTKDNQGYGHIVGHPKSKLYKLNEEHGFVRYDPSQDNYKIGQTLDIIPYHSCILPNLCDYIFAFRKGQFARRIRIDARGKNF